MRSIAISIFFISFSAGAMCPELTGTYTTCKFLDAKESTSSTTVSQVTSNQITTYTFTTLDSETGEQTTEIVKADGVLRTLQQTDSESGVVLLQTSKASCASGTLVRDMAVSAEGQTFANLKGRTSKSGPQLTTVTTGTVMGEAINETQICY